MTPEAIKKERIKIKKSRYLKEYGLEVLHLLLKKDKYTHCSFSNKAIPGPGSETMKIENCEQPIHHEITKVVIHRKEDKITLFTKVGNVQYLKL